MGQTQGRHPREAPDQRVVHMTYLWMAAYELLVGAMAGMENNLFSMAFTKGHIAFAIEEINGRGKSFLGRQVIQVWRGLLQCIFRQFLHDGFHVLWRKHPFEHFHAELRQLLVVVWKEGVRFRRQRVKALWSSGPCLSTHARSLNQVIPDKQIKMVAHGNGRHVQVICQFGNRGLAVTFEVLENFLSGWMQGRFDVSSD